MSSGAGPSQGHSNCRFPTADVRIIPAKERCIPSLLPGASREKVYVAVSLNIHWQKTTDDVDNQPHSLADFRNMYSLEIDRLEGNASRNDVEQVVKAEESSDGNPSIIVPGSLHGPSRRVRVKKKVKIELTPECVEQRDAWLEQLRARITPWKLIRQEMKKLRSVMQQSGSIEDMGKSIEGMVVGDRPSDVTHDLPVPDTPSEEVHEIAAATSRPFSSPHGFSNETVSKKLSKIPEKLQKLDWAGKLHAQIHAGIGTGVTATKMADKARQVTPKEGVAEKATQVAETAQFVADVSKYVAGVSTAFQLLALGARMVSEFAETNRGVLILPGTLDRAIFLLTRILQCLGNILDISANVEILHEDFAFKVLEKTVDTIVLIETQLLRGWGSRFLRAKVVKEIYSTMEDLEQKVVTTTLLGKPETQSHEHVLVDGKHHYRPEPSPFFVGRTKELEELKSVLHDYGSAAIAQYGGVGKTELMIALAHSVEREVPGGVFWLTVNGGLDQVVESLACFVDKLRRLKMTETERRDRIVVTAQLKDYLSEKKGRWLLCLDNADNEEISPVLDAVCAIADPKKKNGWVVVTSRMGQPRLWQRMKKEQKITLQPLSTDDAMNLLRRQVSVVEAKDVNDATVMGKLSDMMENETREYHALKELCGNDCAYSLGGLPLALVQAGTYIGRFERSFSGYVKLLKETNDNAELDRIFKKAELLSPVNDAQKSILTTWKISVDCLSNKAYEVLRSLSMLGPGPIPEVLVKGVLSAVNEDEFMKRLIRDVLMDKLVHGSSLVFREKSIDGDTFGLHRLVRRFVLADMERESVVWNKSYKNAFLSLYSRIEDLLAAEGHSLQDFPEVFGDQYRKYLLHLFAIIDNYGVPSSWNSEVVDVSHLYDIACFTYKASLFFGLRHLTVNMWRSVMTALESYHGANSNQPSVAYAMGTLGLELMERGKLVEAESMFERSLKMLKAIHGENSNHDEIATLLNNLGSLYKTQGKLMEAELMYEQCLEMRNEIFGRDANHPRIAISLNNLGGLYASQGKLLNAESMYEQCLRMRKVIHGENTNHLEIASILNNLGSLCSAQSKLVGAESMFEQCLDMRKAIYGQSASHPEIANVFNGFACLYESQGMWVKAEAMHRRCLKMKRDIYGENANHPEIALTLSNLGYLYATQGKYILAESMYEECLNMRKEIYGKNAKHHKIAAIFNHIAHLYELQGKLGEAELFYTKSLEMQREIYGCDSNHPEIAATLNNFGSLYESQGKWQASELMYQECLKMRRDIYGENANHPDIAKTLNGLGVLCEARGKLHEAEFMLQECLEMERAVYGRNSNHPLIAATMKNLGNLFRSQRKLDAAESMLYECLAMEREMYGANTNHFEIAITMNNLGLLYCAQGKYIEAESMYEQCLAMRRDIYGENADHPDIALILNNFGHLYATQDKLESAELMFEQCLHMSRRIYGENATDHKIANLLNNLGQLYATRGKLVEAESTHKQCLEMRKELYGESASHPEIATTLNNLASVYEKQDKLVEAEEMFLQCLNMLKYMFGSDTSHPSAAMASSNLGGLYKKQGKLIEAEEMYQECLRMMRDIHGSDSTHPHITKTMDRLAALRETQS